MTLALVLGYAVLLLVTLLVLLHSHWPGWIKTLLVVGATALYFVGHEVVHALLGLPSSDALPERFVMLSAAVEEPTPRSPGALYLWVSPLVEGRPGLAPRAYRLPYTKSLHEQLDAGLARGREGVEQMGTAESVRPGNGSGWSFLQPGRDEQEIHISDLPARQLPEK